MFEHSTDCTCCDFGHLRFSFHFLEFFVWGASPGSAGCFNKATQTPNAYAGLLPLSTDNSICPMKRCSAADDPDLAANFFKRNTINENH
jgi:hypothetical protein